MSMRNLVLLTGANGRTGRAVLAALSRAGAEVRVFVRKAEQFESLRALGACELAVGDMLDADSVRAAVKDCARLVHIGPPMHPQEREITASFIAAARDLGIAQFVYYSVMHPLRTEVRHHRLKLEAESLLVASGLPYTIVQPMRYMQHLEPIWRQVKEEGVHAMPFSTEVRFSVVDLLDLAAAVAHVTAREGHLHATYELAGPEALSQDDMAATLTQLLGRPVRARAIPLDEMQARARKAGASEDRIEQMTAMNRHYDEHGFLGNANVLGWLLGRAPTRYADYVRRLIAAG